MTNKTNRLQRPCLALVVSGQQAVSSIYSLSAIPNSSHRVYPRKNASAPASPTDPHRQRPDPAVRSPPTPNKQATPPRGQPPPSGCMRRSYPPHAMVLLPINMCKAPLPITCARSQRVQRFRAGRQRPVRCWRAGPPHGPPLCAPTLAQGLSDVAGPGKERDLLIVATRDWVLSPIHLLLLMCEGGGLDTTSVVGSPTRLCHHSIGEWTILASWQP